MNFDKVTITQQLRYKQIMNTQARMKVVCAENIEKRIQEQNKQKKILYYVMFCIKWYHIVIVNTPGPLLALFACNSTVQTMPATGQSRQLLLLCCIACTGNNIRRKSCLTCLSSSRQSKGQLVASPTPHSFVLVAAFT